MTLDFQKKQAEFAAHLRNPELHQAPECVEERRLAIYRELFYNNVEGFLSGGFPVTKSLFAEAEWQNLVRDFYTHHKARTPYFLEISEEFLAYLDNEQLPCHRQFPFLTSLAHYEWVELALDVSDEQSDIKIDPNGDLLSGRPVLSALAWPLVYEWPVHLIGPGYTTAEPSGQPVCLVVYRNRSDKVEFMEANPVTLRLLEIINSEPYPTGDQAFTQIAQEMQADTQAIIRFGLPVLEQLRELGIISGTRV